LPSLAFDSYRTEALTVLAPHLPVDLLAEALTAARSLEYEGERAKALAALVRQLPEQERPGVLAEALAAALLSLKEDRTEALAKLVPHLPVDLLTEAFAAARGIGDEGERAKAL